MIYEVLQVVAETEQSGINLYEVLVVILGIPAAIVTGLIGMATWMIKRHIRKAEEDKATHASDRKKFEQFLVNQLAANTALTEAVAVSMQNGRVNGEIKAALNRLEGAKREQRLWLQQQGIDKIFMEE